MPGTTLPALSRKVLAAARARGLKIATAESCTGGMVAMNLTAIAGSSDVVDRGFVTYSNAAKEGMLGVHPDIIDELGAVSEDVAKAMAGGAVRVSQADITVAITGIAGPGGGTLKKPVGLVYIAAASRDGRLYSAERRYDPGLKRAGIRRAATRDALLMLLAMAEETSISA